MMCTDKKIISGRLWIIAQPVCFTHCCSVDEWHRSPCSSADPLFCLHFSAAFTCVQKIPIYSSEGVFFLTLTQPCRSRQRALLKTDVRKYIWTSNNSPVGAGRWFCPGEPVITEQWPIKEKQRSFGAKAVYSKIQSISQTSHQEKDHRHVFDCSLLSALQKLRLLQYSISTRKYGGPEVQINKTNHSIQNRFKDHNDKKNNGKALVKIQHYI